MAYSPYDIVEYLVALINEFSKKFTLTEAEAYRYIRNHQGLKFANDNYGALHTLDINEAVDCVAQICRKNGGAL